MSFFEIFCFIKQSLVIHYRLLAKISTLLINNLIYLYKMPDNTFNVEYREDQLLILRKKGIN